MCGGGGGHGPGLGLGVRSRCGRGLRIGVHEGLCAREGLLGACELGTYVQRDQSAPGLDGVVRLPHDRGGQVRAGPGVRGRAQSCLLLGTRGCKCGVEDCLGVVECFEGGEGKG